MTDVDLLAWADQFGALLRDKVREMQLGLDATGWTSMAHVFESVEGDSFRLIYEDGEFYVSPVPAEDGMIVVLDLDSLGV